VIERINEAQRSDVVSPYAQRRDVRSKRQPGINSGLSTMRPMVCNLVSGPGNRTSGNPQKGPATKSSDATVALAWS
jgi:hypothetical protein